MATIEARTTKDGKTHYRVLVRLKGAPPASATFRKKTDAATWAAKTESEIREGRYFHHAEARRHTLAEAIDRYTADVLPRKSPTMEVHQLSQFKWWKEKLGHLVLADVTPAVISAARDELIRTPVRGKDPSDSDKPRKRSAGSVNRYMAALSHLLAVCSREWGWLEANPARNVSRLREPTGRVRFLSDDERDRLLKACRESTQPLLYPLVVLALSTGARSGELLGLRWGNVDLERHVIRLEKTKNRTRRALPLAGLAFAEVEKLSRVRRIDTDLVFPRPGEDRPINPRPAWLRALKAAGIHDFHFHDLRHSAASYLAMNGATLAEIAAILGHRTLAMVGRYSHLTEQHTSAVVERMNAAVFGGDGG